jgi:hypothetical protein
MTRSRLDIQVKKGWLCFFFFILNLLLVKDGRRRRTLCQDLSSVPARQDLTAAGGRLVIVATDSRQALGICFDGLHC